SRAGAAGEGGGGGGGGPACSREREHSHPPPPPFFFFFFPRHDLIAQVAHCGHAHAATCQRPLGLSGAGFFRDMRQRYSRLPIVASTSPKMFVYCDWKLCHARRSRRMSIIGSFFRRVRVGAPRPFPPPPPPPLSPAPLPR